MKTRFIFTLVIIAIIAIGLRAQTPDEIIKDFFEKYEKIGAEALDDVFKSNPWFAEALDQFEGLKSGLANYNEETVGKYYGYEPITTIKLTDSYIVCAYFLKFDRQFLRATFQFYKPEDEWRLFNIEFDADYDEEMKDIIKSEYYKKLKE